MRDTMPAQVGHTGLPTAADRASSALADQLARSIGHKAAVSWVHAGAVLAWTASHGLLGDIEQAGTATGIQDGLKRLGDAHPALADWTDPDTVDLWQHRISDDEAARIHSLWAEHPVDDPEYRPHGYLLGNAYQALSKESRKHRALAQTPRYVTDLLLDLALTPALDEHGRLGDFRMADPSCGTGHILVESLLKVATWAQPGRAAQYVGTPDRILRALDAVHGVDLDPYAALIARLRLVAMAAAMFRAHGATVPADAPVNVAAANSLLDTHPLLTRGRYHAIVANPPYITPKTEKERNAVRAAYPEVCSGKYALSVPFHQLMTELLAPGGWCAQLTANSFMKREFGTKFIEEYLPRFDLRWVIDTSGAYIPGHGTPTVILVHRNQAPSGSTVATVRGVQGEPKAPEDPSRGLVWTAIDDQVRQKLAYERLAAGIERSQGQPDTPTIAPPALKPEPVYVQPTLLDLLPAA